ncbi:2-oxoisovalerate dehydrogenase subunit alpha 1, mitochondrial [Grifola frondosa]|uniref:2-oxoisovalerate dehydrogenase subunit alpha n=1 Tax=Grifola frondosa TaxID=5627 RepID=A0A1C7LWE8_GRIFR|nr:2-oxoisovalerate dehydrogenase subunit alpha 1, mitochondrial [Grifola frondosa]
MSWTCDCYTPASRRVAWTPSGVAVAHHTEAAFLQLCHGGRKTYPYVQGYRRCWKPIEGAEIPDIDEAMARKMYENMVQLPIIDNLLNNVQRQGKIVFYMTSHGEEAAIIGSAAALAPDDEVLGKGKQMPVHFGSKEFHYHTISSPLSTQIPQAAGVGYALKRDPSRRGRNCAAVFFGDGAASEGDFHAGMLLASTVPSPTLFIARNNGFAISTPASEQFLATGLRREAQDTACIPSGWMGTTSSQFTTPSKKHVDAVSRMAGRC